MIEQFQLACKTCNHAWSFFAGVATYAAFQAGALKYVLSASRFVLPPQFHLTLVVILTLISMVLKMVTFRLKTCIVSAVSKISSMTSSPNEPSKPNSPQAASDADKPTRPMRKPRVINQNLTSVEFMPQVPAALSHSIDKESNDEVKID